MYSQRIELKVEMQEEKFKKIIHTDDLEEEFISEEEVKEMIHVLDHVLL